MRLGSGAPASCCLRELGLVTYIWVFLWANNGLQITGLGWKQKHVLLSGTWRVTHERRKIPAHIPTLVWVGYGSYPQIKNHARTYLRWILDGYLIPIPELSSLCVTATEGWYNCFHNQFDKGKMNLLVKLKLMDSLGVIEIEIHREIQSTSWGTPHPVEKKDGFLGRNQNPIPNLWRNTIN
jgi:hypothetical protein